MARVLVMIPSGEVYDHDCVRWYGYQDIQRNINGYHNIGDAFVYDSSLKLLNFEKLAVLPIAEPSMAEIDRLREEYDYVFIRGSNYINATMNWRQAVAVIAPTQTTGHRLRHRGAGAGKRRPGALGGIEDHLRYDG